MTSRLQPANLPKSAAETESRETAETRGRRLVRASPEPGSMSGGGEIGLHVCCAPCLSRAGETVRRSPAPSIPRIAMIFFHNPNIHPLLEFRRRVKALKIYLERNPLRAEIDDGYGLRSWLSAMTADGGLHKNRRDRCRRCYFLRLSRAAEKFGEWGFEGFSTTLFASREQDHELIEDAGREAAAEAGMEFHAVDFSGADPREKELRGIYRQQYCGCIFSEEERYRNTGKHCYPVPSG